MTVPVWLLVKRPVDRDRPLLDLNDKAISTRLTALLSRSSGRGFHRTAGAVVPSPDKACHTSIHFRGLDVQHGALDNMMYW